MSKNCGSFKKDYNLKDYELLGEGHNGKVYLMPDNKALKLFKQTNVCKNEYFLLKKVSGNRYFPKIHKHGKNYIIRDCINGISLKEYIEQNGLSKDLSLKLIDLIEEFKKLKFKKLDIRCRDIFVQPDGSLMTIDPKNYYTRNRDYPRHLCKGLNKLMVLDTFMDALKCTNFTLYEKWSKKIYKYLDKHSNNL